MKIKFLYNLIIFLILINYAKFDIESNNTKIIEQNKITNNNLNKTTKLMNVKLVLNNNNSFENKSLNDKINNNKSLFQFLSIDLCLICQLTINKLKEEMGNNTEKLKIVKEKFILN